MSCRYRSIGPSLRLVVRMLSTLLAMNVCRAPVSFTNEEDRGVKALLRPIAASFIERCCNPAPTIVMIYICRSPENRLTFPVAAPLRGFHGSDELTAVE